MNTGTCKICNTTNAEIYPLNGWVQVKCNVCGDYKIDCEALTDAAHYLSEDHKRCAVSYAIRQASEAKSTMKVTSEILEKLAKEDFLPTPREQADNFVRYLGSEEISREGPGNQIGIKYTEIVAVIGSTSSNGVAFVVKYLVLPPFNFLIV